ncbi:extracellular solute-binding protein [Breznakiellaceae bacterium SP9]
MRYNKTFPLLLCLTCLLTSCALYEYAAGLFTQPTVAAVWTDRPEFALYTEYFNTSQSEYKVELHYYDSPALKLTDASNTAAFPDIVVGSWLKSTATRNLFKPLDDYFEDGILEKEAFYPRLLALGTIENAQYLLPVSFNIPAIVFERSKGELLKSRFTVSLDEIRDLGKEYNTLRGGAFTRMGFSPSWSENFMYLTAVMNDVSFREGTPAAYNAAALELTMDYIQDWIRSANTNIQMEDDFAFKYFYDPPAKLILGGRILFTAIESSKLFTLPEEQRKLMDFRWITKDGPIPLSDEAVYYGIYHNSKAVKAARAFTAWFFSISTQEALLENARLDRMRENHFGIAGGFSGLRTVTEQVFPRYYQDLLGHMPPADALSPPNILPRHWTTLKEKVLFPYLRERIRYAGSGEFRPLDRRIFEWNRLQR